MLKDYQTIIFIKKTRYSYCFSHSGIIYKKFPEIFSEFRQFLKHQSDFSETPIFYSFS